MLQFIGGVKRWQVKTHGMSCSDDLKGPQVTEFPIQGFYALL